MSSDIIRREKGVSVPADLSSPQAVHDFLSALLPATRGEMYRLVTISHFESGDT